MRAIGHDHTWIRLEQALRDDQLAHALLFTGPPGIGKSLLARDLAARTLCTGGKPPCGDCDRCRQIDAGSHPDVRFVGIPVGKKEIGVELAREIKSFLQLRSAGGGVRVVVIDDADRLSIAAQNALLKTLEEPPGHALVILVTGSPGGLLPTVRSRCQRVTLRPLGDDALRAVLRGQNLDDSTIEPLLPYAQGSAGRALQMRGLIERADIERLQSALARLRSGRYGPVVEFTQALGANEQEMSSRLDMLTEVLQQRLASSIRTGSVDEGSIHEQLRVIEILSEIRRMLRRGNPNRSLLAEAAALRCARVLTDDTYIN